MEYGNQALELSAGVLSPQGSVDLTSKDRAVVTEGKPIPSTCPSSDLVQIVLLTLWMWSSFGFHLSSMYIQSLHVSRFVRLAGGVIHYY